MAVQQYITTIALCDIVISKAPQAIRMKLADAKDQNKPWHEISRIAEDAIWIVSSRRQSMSSMVIQANNQAFYHPVNSLHSSRSYRQPKSAPYQQQTTRNHFSNRNQNSASGKTCELHGPNTHATEECFTLKKMKQNGWYKSAIPKRTINSVSQYTTQLTEENSTE